MDVVLKISAVAVVGAILALVVKKYAPENAMLVTLGCGVVAFLALISVIGELVTYWNILAARVAFADAAAKPLLKAAGIAVVSKISSELCRDCGQGALGAKVELAGTAACILVMMPLAEAVFDLIESML